MTNKECLDIIIDNFKDNDNHYSILELYGDGWFLDQDNDFVHICDPVNFVNFNKNNDLDGFNCEFYDNPNVHWDNQLTFKGECGRCGVLAPAILRVKLLLDKV